jgi:hypothetical protein
MTAAQFATVQHIFHRGVCNYAKPPVGYVKHTRTWLAFGDPRLNRRAVAIPYPLVRSRVP